MSYKTKLAMRLFHKYPIMRGMLTYSILYPSSNVLQQWTYGKSIDWEETLRFGVFGCFWVAPTLYSWVKVAGILFPVQNVLNIIKKVLLEQVTYSPFAIISFYTGMNLLQGKKDVGHIERELKTKFLATYKAGCVYWPLVQSFNFSVVREKNRVPVVAVASFFWVAFLSYMKKQELENQGCRVTSP